MISVFITAVVAFGLGSFLGTPHDGSEPPPARSPDVWQPVDHNDMLRTCGQMCGMDNLESYNAIYGACECKK